jgi:hypothetical protein
VSGIGAEDLENDFERPPDFDRGQGDAPYVTLPDGKRKLLSRTSGLGDVLDEKSGLGNWKTSKAMEGLGRDPALLAEVIAVTPYEDHRSAWTTLRERAINAGKGGQKRDIGTAVHKMSERWEQDPTFDPGEPYRSALQAYTDELDRLGLKSQMMEVQIVNLELGVGGTTDRIYEATRPLVVPTGEVLPPGTQIIGDLKHLALDTPIPTPEGWTTMAAVAVGDAVFAMSGEPCVVVAKSDVVERPSYRVVFDDGTSLVASDEHRWVVDVGPLHAIRREVMTTDEIASSQEVVRIPVANALDLPTVALPVDPYAFGLWLADGKHTEGSITKPLDSGVWEELERRGFEISPPHGDGGAGKCPSRTVYGLRGQLRHMGVLGDKHIPRAFMRASAEQRLDLLRGLMDGDGSANKARRGRAVFSACDKQLAHDVYELVLSLGDRATPPYRYMRSGFGLTVESWTVEWAPLRFNPFAGEKAARVTVGPTGRNHRRVVKSVERVPTVPMQCIAVDSPDHTFLCGEAMIPTHNTGDSLEFTAPGYCVQFAGYAGGQLYDVVNNVFMPTPDINQSWAILVHINVEEAHCEFLWMDLEVGRFGAKLANEVKEWRRAWRRKNGYKAGVLPVEVAADDAVVEPEPTERPDHESVDAWLAYCKNRLTVIGEHEAARKWTMVRWPEGLKGPKSAETLEEAQALSAFLDRVEAEFQLPFVEGQPVPPREKGSKSGSVGMTGGEGDQRHARRR